MYIFRQLAIRHKLFGAYAGVSLIILTLSFSFLYFQMKKQITRNIKEELAKSNQIITDMVEIAANVAIKNHLKAVAEKNHDIVTYFYRQHQDKKLTETEAMNRAKQVLLSQRIGKTGYIYCIDSRTVVRVHPKKKLVGNDVSNFEFVGTQAKEKRGYLEYDWKNPGESMVRSKALYMTYFEPWDWIISATSYKSEFMNLVSSHDFKESISRLTFGDTGYAFIIDKSGKFLVHPGYSEKTSSDLDREAQAILHKMVKKEQGFLTYLWKNKSDSKYREKLTAFDTISTFNWVIASSSYTWEVFSPLAKTKNYFLFILWIAFLATGVVTLEVSNYITTPLVSMINRFEKSSRGKSFFRMKTNRNDEIGKLSGSLNLFMNRLDAYQQDLVKENKERKKGQKEIRTLRNYLANIIDSMPSILIGIDSKLKILFWNNRAEKITGIPSIKACGCNLDEVVPLFDMNALNLNDILVKKKPRYFSKRRVVFSKKQTFLADITIYPLAFYENKGGVIRIDDVTQKVQMEERLIQNEKISSLGGLTAGMAHEIKNPLAGIIQNTNVLSNRLNNLALPANRTAAQKAGISMEEISVFSEIRNIPRILDSILESGLRVTQVIENMLSFARKAETHFSPQDPAKLMDKTLMLALIDDNFKFIKIKKEYEGNLPLVFCEKSKIQQVILNLLRNGSHAMLEYPRQSEPTFTLRLHTDQNCGMLCMEVEDNGPGMETETRKRLFEPFFTTKPAGTGTGLGLAVSRFIIVETHGGTLDVASKKGKGTNFMIRLPLKTPGSAQ